MHGGRINYFAICFEPCHILTRLLIHGITSQVKRLYSREQSRDARGRVILRLIAQLLAMLGKTRDKLRAVITILRAKLD